MSTLCVVIVVPFVIGLLANLVYDVARNGREYMKTGAWQLTGSYKIYWYNSTNIRDQSNRKVSCASVAIRRDWLYRAAVHFKQDDLGDGEYEGYEYKGFMRAFESQIHWTMHGVIHGETYYAIFDRRLGKRIDALPGLYLLTANDRFMKPMAIRCLLCAENVPLERVNALLGAKDYLTVKG